jgi:hypothetical protein
MQKIDLIKWCLQVQFIHDKSGRKPRTHALEVARQLEI